MNNTNKMKASETLKYCIHVSEQIQREVKVCHIAPTKQYVSSHVAILFPL